MSLIPFFNGITYRAYILMLLLPTIAICMVRQLR